MQKSYYILIAIMALCFTAKAQDLVTVRNHFYRTVNSAASTDSLNNILSKINSSSKIELHGYKAMASFMVCYHSYNPYTKYKYFLDAKEQLEQAIKKDSGNIELRFLRLTVQLNTPSFLGYNSNIKADKLIILNNAKNISDADLFSRIYNYTITSKKLNESEKKKLQQALLANKLASTIKK